MVSATPQSESVDLGNEAISLPLADSLRREQIVWRLRTLLRNHPHDVVARTALMTSYFRSGAREQGMEELERLYAMRGTASLASRHQLVRGFIITGQLEKAREVLRGTALQVRDVELLNEDFILEGLGADDLDFCRSNVRPHHHTLKKTLEFLDKNRLDTALSCFSQSVAETVGPVACHVDIGLNDQETGDIEQLVFRFRAPMSFADRRGVERNFLRLWRERLDDAGLSVADALPHLVLDLAELPKGDRDAA